MISPSWTPRTSSYAAAFPNEKNVFRVDAGRGGAHQRDGLGDIIAATFAAYLSLLACEQLRTDCAYTGMPVRLLAAVRVALGPKGEAVTALRTPPFADELGGLRVGTASDAGVPVATFPRWLLCPACRLLAPIRSHLFELDVDRYRPERSCYVHRSCLKSRKAEAIPVRFLLACKSGHLDDFPWAGDACYNSGLAIGAQLLFEGSEEIEPTPGLGLLPGQVTWLRADQRLPHIGWNEVRFERPSALTAGLPVQGCPFYHVHSFVCRPEDQRNVVATAEYGERFATIVRRESVFGVQFHPEKSSRDGLSLLKRFLALRGASRPDDVTCPAA